MNFTLYTDGGARGNPGPAAAGIVILDADGQTLLTASKYLGETTNNQAEYQALIFGLTEVTQQSKVPAGINLQVYMDSELIIRQMLGEYKVKEAGLKLLHDEAAQLVANLGQVVFSHIRREKNAVADRLVNDELDKRA